MQEPADFVKSHMPFDPMWQLLYQPITTAEFYGQKVAKDANYLFNYSDSISADQVMPEPQMYANAMRRMEWAGIGNESSARYYALLKRELASALEAERRRLSEMWLYAFEELEKSYQTSVEMYEQLQVLKTDYAARGVSVGQLRYQSDVLLEHSKRCAEALAGLRLSEQANLSLWRSLSQRVARMHDLIEQQHGLIRQATNPNAEKGPVR